MAPRSARKRRPADSEATVSRRRKRESSTPTHEERPKGASDETSPEGGAGAEGQDVEISEEIPVRPLSLDPEDSRLLMMALEASSSAELEQSSADINSFGIQLLETPYEEDEQDEDEGDQHQRFSSIEGDADVTVNATQQQSDLVEEVEAKPSSSGGGETLQGTSSVQPLDVASASIEELLHQLADVATNFMTNFRELTSEGEAIHAELLQINADQDMRCASMLTRLQRAGNSILSFGDPDDPSREQCEDEQVSQDTPAL